MLIVLAWGGAVLITPSLFPWVLDPLLCTCTGWAKFDICIEQGQAPVITCTSKQKSTGRAIWHGWRAPGGPWKVGKRKSKRQSSRPRLACTKNTGQPMQEGMHQNKRTPSRPRLVHTNSNRLLHTETKEHWVCQGCCTQRALGKPKLGYTKTTGQAQGGTC